jgi:hypothetical protein
MPKIQKIEKVDQIVAKLSESKSAALIQYQGLSAGDISNLRANIKRPAFNGSYQKLPYFPALNKIGLSLPETLTARPPLLIATLMKSPPLKKSISLIKIRKTFFKYGIYNKKLLSLEELNIHLLPSKSALVAQFIGGLKILFSALSMPCALTSNNWF